MLRGRTQQSRPHHKGPARPSRRLTLPPGFAGGGQGGGRSASSPRLQHPDPAASSPTLPSPRKAGGRVRSRTSPRKSGGSEMLRRRRLSKTDSGTRVTQRHKEDKLVFSGSWCDLLLWCWVARTQLPRHLHSKNGSEISEARVAFRSSATIGHMKGTKATVCRWLVIVIIAAIVGGCWLLDRAPRRGFERLIRGDNEVELNSLTISGQGMRIELSDPDSVRYLTNMFRSAEAEGHVPGRSGLSYYAKANISGHGSVTIGLYVPEDVEGVTISYPIDSLWEPQYLWVRFSNPMPAVLSAALEQMKCPPACNSRGKLE